jgi:alpha-glucosidase
LPAAFGQLEALDLAVDASGSREEGTLALPLLGCFLARIA